MAQKLIVPLIWLLGLIVFVLGIAGAARAPARNEITTEMSDFFICIIIFTLMMAVLGLVNHWIKSKSGQNNYDVEQPGKAGADNKAFEKEASGGGDASSGGQKGPGGKWTKNYVPFKGFPKGSADTDQDINGVEVVNEVSDEKRETGNGSGDEKWKKNYVPYQENQPAEEDSNKQ